MSRPLIRAVAAVTAAGAVFAACYKVPYTGRKALNPVPDALMVALSKSTYAQTLANSKIERKGEDAELLDKIGRKIARAAKKPDYDWQVALIDEDTVNAWCLPGGKIGFYSGILPVLRHEAGVAFVMGHEVGHAIARHGGERMAQQVALFGGLAGMNGILSTNTKLTMEQRTAVVGVLGIAVEVGAILPFSRMHESEADVIGTMYMASAGYPPGEAVKVWDRMAKESGGSALPAFLSTHPADAKRQEVIKQWLPKARKRYQRNKIERDTTEPRWGKGGNTSMPKKKKGDGGSDKPAGGTAPRGGG